jgi:hypothetical protein
MFRSLAGVVDAQATGASYGTRPEFDSVVAGVPKARGATCPPDLYRKHTLEARCAGLGSLHGAT